MNFKVKHAFSFNSLLNHHDLVSSVSWLSSEEFVSCGDDHQLLIWNVVSGVNSVFYLLSNGSYPVCMQWSPAQVATSIKQSNEILALGTSNGTLLLLKKNGRLEKCLDAHTGVICCIKWSPDGNSVATSGEDGLIKIWSRLGMLRSTFIHADIPIYCVAWRASNEQVIDNIFCLALLTVSLTISAYTPLPELGSIKSQILKSHSLNIFGN